MWKSIVLLTSSLLCAIADNHLKLELPEYPSYKGELEATESQTHMNNECVGDVRCDDSDQTSDSEKAIDNEIADAEDEEDEDEIVHHKRFINNMFRSRPPKSEGYKRGPGFRSWGGKRSDGDVSHIEGEFIMPFQQQLKRSTQQVIGHLAGNKRRPFQSWGGKRSPLQIYLPQEDLPRLIESKRKFNSWGGKRSKQEFIEKLLEKRKFNSWGGKRWQEEHKRSGASKKKPSFQSWGGKRSHLLHFD